jgi:hypothetical protein
VTFASKQGSLGNLVIIDHGHGMLTRYGHLNKILINRGDFVKEVRLLVKWVTLEDPRDRIFIMKCI